MKKEKTFHYTNEKMVIDLFKSTNFLPNDIVLDAGSGKNKVWQKNCPVQCFECEIEDGCNFYEWNTQVDWVIGNPPYHESWKFTKHSVSIARKGIAWLINNQALNSHLTPARLDFLKENGFEYTNIHIVADRRWFGRYYFVILEKEKKGILTWERKTY